MQARDDHRPSHGRPASARFRCLQTADLVNARLARQHLSSDPLGSPEEVVRSLLAVQAQEYEESKWSMAQRSGGPAESEVEALLADGRILRTHVMRPTWHYVLPEDLGWLQRLTGPRVHVANRASYNRVGHSDDDLRRADEVMVGAFADGEPRTRRELGAALTDAGYADCAKGERLTHAVMHAELEGLIASGPRRDKQFTYLPVDPAIRAGGPSGEAALAELARRYFTAHGPARAQDLAWWSGLTLTQARAALELVSAALESSPFDGKPSGAWWFAPGSMPALSGPARALMLGSFDESHIGYREPRAVAPHELRLGFDFERPLLIEGRVVAGWRREKAARSVRVEVRPVGSLSGAERDLVAIEAKRFATFLALPLELTVAKPGVAMRR